MNLVGNIDQVKNPRGYIWLSNESNPRIINGLLQNEWLQPNQVPFIVEGYLRDEANNHYLIYQNGMSVKTYVYTAAELSDCEVKVISFFMAKEMEGYTKIVFKEYWQRQKNQNCENMEIPVPWIRLFEKFDH